MRWLDSLVAKELLYLTDEDHQIKACSVSLDLACQRPGE